MTRPPTKEQAHDIAMSLALIPIEHADVASLVKAAVESVLGPVKVTNNAFVSIEPDETGATIKFEMRF